MELFFITDIDLNVIAIVECDSYSFDIIEGVPYYSFFTAGRLFLSLNASHLFVHSEFYMNTFMEAQLDS